MKWYIGTCVLLFGASSILQVIMLARYGRPQTETWTRVVAWAIPTIMAVIGLILLL